MVDIFESHVFIWSPVFLLSLVMLYLLGMHLYFHRKKSRLPAAQTPMRTPGQSLLKKMACIKQQILIYTGLPFLIIISAGVGYYARLTFFNHPVTVFEVGLVGLVGLGGIGYGLLHVAGLLRRLRRVRLAYESKTTVGEVLNDLSPGVYHIFHDFPAEQFNIDHVVVGEKGIFTVETSAHSKPSTNGFQKQAPVEYNGKVLYFPNGKDLKTVERAERQADWLSEWIGATTGVPVAARAIVALPGWIVKRTSPDGIPVVNPYQFSSLFEHIKSRPIYQDAVMRIVDHLEKMCRNTTPEPSPTGAE